MEGSHMFLGVDVSKAPPELRDALTGASRAYKRYQKARGQQVLWNTEHELSVQEHNVAQRRYNDALNRWNMDTNEMAKALEDAPAHQ